MPFSACGDRHRLRRNACWRAGLADRGHAGADRQFAGDEVGAARRATRLGVVVGEQHAFGGELVEVRRAAGHHAAVVSADVPHADVVAHDDDDVRPLPPAGAAAGCCACAELVSPTAESAEAATRELPLSSKSRRFSPPPAGSRCFSRLCGVIHVMTRVSSAASVVARAQLADRRVGRCLGSLDLLDHLIEVVLAGSWRGGSIARWRGSAADLSDRPPSECYAQGASPAVARPPVLNLLHDLSRL